MEGERSAGNGLFPAFGFCKIWLGCGMPLGKRVRKWLWSLALTGAGIVLLWAAMPWWFPWALRPVARRFGVQYSRYERHGYSRFSIQGLNYADQSASVRAEHIEALVPNVWLWRLAVTTQTEPFVTVNAWQFREQPGGKPAGPAFPKVQQASKTLAVLQRWIPRAELTAGTLRLGQAVVSLPTVRWSVAGIDGAVVLPGLKPEQRFAVQISRAQPFAIRIRSDSLHLQSAFGVATNSSGFEVQGNSLWWSNRVELEAHFGRNSVLPETARLRADNVRLPAEVARLPEYQDLSGTLAADWHRDRFSLDLTAGARPVVTQTNLPPLTLVLHAYGGTNSVTIRTATLSSAWLEAGLSQELTIYAHGQLLRSPATLRLSADLAKVPWVRLEGKLAGEANFVPATEKLPAVQFQLFGTRVGLPSLQAEKLDLQGRFDWPNLEISDAQLAFTDGSFASAGGAIQLTNQTISEGRLSFRGPLVRRWLPAGYDCQGLAVSGTFHGPLKALVHSGHLAATNVTSPFLQPCRVEADWSGRQLNALRVETSVTVTNASVLVHAALTNENRRSEFQLETLTLLANRQPMLELGHPCRIGLVRGHNWRITATPIEWEGPGGQVRAQAFLEWPVQGMVQLSLTELSSELLNEFAKRGLPDLAVHRLQGSVGWTNGPAQFALDLSVAGQLPSNLEGHLIPAHVAGAGSPLTNSIDIPAPPGSRHQQPPTVAIAAELTVKGDQTGIALPRLLITSSTSTVIRAQGLLPATINPGLGSNTVQIDAEKPLQFDAAVQPEGFFWSELADWTGVRLGTPHLNLELSGTWQAARGEIKLDARQVQLPVGRTRWPRLEDLQIQVLLDREKARLSQCRLLVQGQPVNLSGEVPLGRGFWTGLGAKALPDFNQARARLEIHRADLAAFEPMLPKLLTPQGELNADISLLPGVKFDGQLSVQGLRTRPLADLGPIREIDVKMQFRDRTLKLEQATARIGPASVSAVGQADLTGTNWLIGVIPPFQFRLTGTNVPLARQPESIIRSDLALAVTKTNGAPPLISGLAHMRDSYYLSDLSALVPGKVATSARRPPYFSIEDPGLADWRLALDVAGVRFLKVRSPLFNGELSANLKLQGTLKDPIALGDLKIDSGLVRFPFANFQVRQGLVTLSSQDPYHPQLLVSAASKQFGYDLRLEASGAVDAPVVQFNSTPPLSSEQIVLMVTAGQMPQNAFTLTPQQRAQTVALFLGRDVLSQMGFGDQTEDRLTVHSGEQVSDQGRPTYNVEYKLSPTWSLVGERDRFDDYNAGFKWRFYSK
jgi:translocation and assembly module TamB